MDNINTLYLTSKRQLFVHYVLSCGIKPFTINVLGVLVRIIICTYK